MGTPNQCPNCGQSLPAPRRRARAKTEAPEQLASEDWDRLSDWVMEHEPWAAVELRAMVDQCLDHFRGRGVRMADWVAVARNWVRNERIRYGKAPVHRAGPIERAARNILRRTDG